MPQFKVVFEYELTEEDEWLMPSRGYVGHVSAVDSDGNRYPLFFMDPVRLSQELEMDVKAGRPYLAEPGLIVLPEVTVENIHAAVQQLAEQGFFEQLKASGGRAEQT